MPNPTKPIRGPVRTRREPPTVDEAIFAAEGLTADTDAQIEIAAGFLGVPEDEVRSHMRRSLPVRTSSIQSGRRTVIVERKRVRA